MAKAYDPVGGVCLKYETNRAVEVGRIFSGFQELGQVMQNVPTPLKRKESPLDTTNVDEGAVAEKAMGAKAEGNSQATVSQSGGGKKKKKSKR